MTRLSTGLLLGMLLLSGVSGIAQAAPQTGGVLNNRGLFMYYSYVRPEQVRRAVRGIEQERRDTRDSLLDVQDRMEQLRHSLEGYRSGYGITGLRPESASSPARLRAATFGRRAPYYPAGR